jgi:translation initiation factor IF-2
MIKPDDGRWPHLAPDSGGGAASKPAKTRIYEIAKEFSVSSEAMLAIVRGLGVEAKSHMSSVDPATVERVRKEFVKEKEAVKEDFARKREVDRKSRRRAMESKATVPVPEAAAAAPAPEAKPAAPPRRKSKEAGPRRQVDQKVVRANIRKTFADMDTRKRRYRKRGGRPDEMEETPADSTVLHLTEFVSTSELANSMNLSPSQIIAKAMEMGSMVTINQRLDRDMMEMLADEFGFSIEFESAMEEDPYEKEQEEVREEDLKPRPPVVTIMGHVDHGKTSLLDYIRETNVIAGEAGGITQHIGAYHVELDNGVITFLDTPGHEAFTAMRARGAQVTDIVILVVAADDSVMPQTIEAMDHAKAAGVPIVVAVNKIDKPGARPEQVRQELSGRGISPEEWGGQNIFVDVSAKTGQGIEKLLEMLLLQAEVLELRANPDRPARGAIIEARKEKGRGTMVTALVQEGTLRVGDAIVAGTRPGRVRALSDERGNRLQEVGPGTPVGIMGFDDVPHAGESFSVVGTDREAREIATKRSQLLREQEQRYRKHATLETIFDAVKEGQIEEMRVVIKADVEGSVEAFADSLEKIATEEVKMRIMHRGVGTITESDILLAAASEAIVLGFHTDMDPRAREVQKREGVDVRFYDVIYEAVADVRAAMEGLLQPDVERRQVGTAEVRAVFRVPKLGAIAGSMVTSGEVRRTSLVTVRRDGEVVHQSKVASLRRFKDDVSEVKSGFECGIGVADFPGIQEGDVLEFFEEVEVARRL